MTLSLTPVCQNIASTSSLLFSPIAPSLLDCAPRIRLANAHDTVRPTGRLSVSFLFFSRGRQPCNYRRSSRICRTSLRCHFVPSFPGKCMSFPSSEIPSDAVGLRCGKLKGVLSDRSLVADMSSCYCFYWRVSCYNCGSHACETANDFQLVVLQVTEGLHFFLHSSSGLVHVFLVWLHVYIQYVVGSRRRPCNYSMLGSGTHPAQDLL